MKFAVAAIFKNEDPYILEWLAFHRVVGFSHFFIADNQSMDMTRQLLAALQLQGEPITLIDYPDVPGVRPQLGAYESLTRACIPGVDAVAFVDADEFITPTEGESSVVPALSECFADPEVGGVALNWACFGSAGQRFWDDGLVIERFQKRAKQDFPVNQHYKMVVRPEWVDHWSTPHHAKLKQGGYVNSLGQPLAYRSGSEDSLSAHVVWSKVRVNHYVVKSFEEFVLRKSPKGSASKEGRVKHRKYFELHDKNHDACAAMSTFLPAVKMEIARLESLVKDASQQDQDHSSPMWRNWVSRWKAGLHRGS